MREQDGFTYIGLLVVIAVINIGLAVAMTSWATIDKRAKEAELIWRGQQYARAVQCHRQETGGLPDQLDDLLESDCIRALYPDPMTPDGNWRVVRESDLRNEAGFGAGDVLDDIEREVRGPEAFFEQRGASAGAGASPFGRAAGPGRRGAGGGLGGGGTAGMGQGSMGLSGAAQGGRGESLQSAYERLRGLTERLRQDFASSGDGIVGVVSRSTDEGLRLYEGEATYDMWRFVAR